jgi:type I restriction-modification system DNA methylase subunit
MARNEKLTVLEAIKRLQNVIEQKKASLHQLRGEEKALLNQLEEQFGLLDIKEAEKRLTEIKREQERLEKRLTGMVARIESEYDLETIGV